jgi:glycosyltransferase involved in cell wall biosynthesis
MKFLLIHQNFPGQFRHLGPVLARLNHEVRALTPRIKERTLWQGIDLIPYRPQRSSSKDIHPWLTDFETKLIRAEACHAAALRLRDEEGFVPDVILAHHGWGEPMFLRDVWPEVRIGLYCEFYYRSEEPYSNFDPEFPPRDPARDVLRLRLKNINNLVHSGIVDAGLSPTEFQAATFPPDWREKISVIHDGVDTCQLVANPAASLTLPDGSQVSRDDELITFVNRNLEPYRGYHIFMRALPDLLRQRPEARVLIVGNDGVSYGARPPDGKTWKQIFIDEVRPRISDADWARVHFLGHLPYDRFVALLQVSRLHVYLTYPFVLSWSLLETMSVEGAILASDTAPVRELITKDVTGRLVDFFDTDALVREACRLLDDPAARARLGSAAREHVVAHYDLQKVTMPRLLRWVSDLAELPPRRLPI